MGFLDEFNARVAHKMKMIDPSAALPGRETPIKTAAEHYVLRRNIAPPYPEDCDAIMFGMGCFWGAEKKFWGLPGVYITAVGYCAGYTPNPTYEEVCTGKTGHNEAVLVVFKKDEISVTELLKVFWESHDPTQGMRQGNDMGTQYRSGVYLRSEHHKALVLESLAQYQDKLSAAGLGKITTEICLGCEFYFAEEYHQQYLAKNPNGYCGLGGTGILYYS